VLLHLRTYHMEQCAGMLETWRRQLPFGGSMTAEAKHSPYDPWYTKVAFGVFVSLVVGVLAVLQLAPSYIVH
jgi:hypothetical protein